MIFENIRNLHEAKDKTQKKLADFYDVTLDYLTGRYFRKNRG